MASRVQKFVIDDYSGGINTRDPAKQLAPNQFQSCKNLYLVGRGRLLTRHGHKRGSSWADTYKMVKCYSYEDDVIWLANAGSDYGWYKNTTRLTTSGWNNTDTTGAVVGGVFYAFDYSYGPNRYDGSKWTDYGLTPPGAGDVGNDDITRTPAATGGYMTASKYFYRFAYGYGDNDDLGVSDCEVTEETSVTTTGSTNENKVTLGGLPNAVDADTHRCSVHIFRTLAGNSGLGPFYFVDKITSGTSYVDTSPDYLLLKEHDKYEAGETPMGHELAHHNHRLFVGDLSGHTNRIYYSAYAEPDYVEELGFFNVGTEGTIIRMFPLGDVLYVFMHKSVWVVTGDDGDTFRTRQVGYTGTMSGETVARVNDELWYLGKESVMAIGPRGHRPIAPQYPISGLVDCSAMVVEPPDQPPHYLLLMSDSALLINTENGAVLEVDCSGDFGDFNPAENMYCCIMDTDGTYHVGSGGDASTAPARSYKWFEWDTAQDQGYNATNTGNEDHDIPCEFWSADLDFGDPDATKSVELVVVNFSTVINDSDALITLYVDGVSSTTASAHNTTRAVLHGDESVGKRFSVKVTWEDESQNRVGLDEITLYYKTLYLERE